MKCLCLIDNSFKFTIDYSEDGLLFTDQSDWIDLSNIISENIKVELEITNDDLKSNVEFFPGRTTIIPYNKLPSKDACKYDGIYTFKISICDNEQILSRTEAYLKSIYCAYTNLLIEGDRDNAMKLLLQIETLKAHARVKDYKSAEKEFEMITSFITRLNCNCNDF